MRPMNVAKWFFQPINELVEKTRIIILIILRFIFGNASEKTKAIIYHIRNPNQPKIIKHAMINTFSKLTRCELSFFDDFQIINGIPAFVMSREKIFEKKSEKHRSIHSQDSTMKNINFRSVFSVKSNDLDTGEMVTCSCFNMDGKLLICGYKDGSLFVWDADHKHLLHVYENLHNSAVASVIFHEEYPHILISCDFKGEAKILNTNNYDAKPVTYKCYLQWHFMKSYATENIMPILSENGNFIAFPVELAINEINENLWKLPGGSSNKNEELMLKKAAIPLRNPSSSHDIKHCSSKYLKKNILYIFQTNISQLDDNSWGTEYEMAPISKIKVSISSSNHDYDFGNISFSPYDEGILFCVNDRPKSYMIYIPDFIKSPGTKYLLEGGIGKYSKCKKFLVTWDNPLQVKQEHAQNKCSLFQMQKIKELKYEKIASSSSKEQKQIMKGEKIIDPEGAEIAWCDFVNIDEGCTGLATCGISNEVKIVIWDIKERLPIYHLKTKISARDVDLLNWESWKHAMIMNEPTFGLNVFRVSPDGNMIGCFSQKSNNGYIWDCQKGIELLRLKMDESCILDVNHVTNVDFMFSGSSNKFATINQQHVIVWLPKSLGYNSRDTSENFIKLAIDDDEILNGKCICKFSENEDVIGLLRPYASSMNIWELKCGMKAHLTLNVEELIVTSKQSQETEDEDDSTDDILNSGEEKHLVKHTNDMVINSRIMNLNPQIVETKSIFCHFAMSYDGSKVVTCMGDMSVLLWDMTANPRPEFKLLCKLKSNYFPAWDVVFSKDKDSDKLLVVVNDDQGMLYWICTETGMVLERKKGNGERCCQFSIDGTRAMLTSNEMNIEIWDVIKRTKLKELNYNFKFNQSRILGNPYHTIMNDKFAFIGLDIYENPITFTNEMTEQDILDLIIPEKYYNIPRNNIISENKQILVYDKLSRCYITSAIKEKSSTSRSVSIADPNEIETKRINRFPFIKKDLTVEEWKKRTKAPYYDLETSNIISIIDMKGKFKTKQIVYPGLQTDKFIMISNKGRRIASIDKGEHLIIWSAYACEGCIPQHSCLKEIPDFDTNMYNMPLSQYGPGFINYYDCNGNNLLMSLVKNRQYKKVKRILKLAKESNMVVSFRGEVIYDEIECNNIMESNTSDHEINEENLLDIALDIRCPELVQSLLIYLLHGNNNPYEISKVLKSSVVKIAKVYPQILKKLMDLDEMIMSVSQVNVEEWVFESSEYKVTSHEQLNPPTEEIKEIWYRLYAPLKSQYSLIQKSNVNMLANSKVIPYKNAAKVGMSGILRHIMLEKLPLNIYDTKVIRAIIKFKWISYARSLVIEDFIHYVFILFFFTLYAYMLGTYESARENLAKKFNFETFFTYLILFTCMILSLAYLIRKFNQLKRCYEDSQWKAIRKYLRDFWNYIEFISLIIILIPLPMANIRGSSTKTFLSFVSITSILLWSKMLYYAQAFKNTGPLVIIIREIIKDIRFFLILLGCIMFGFGMAFFVLFSFYNHLHSNDDTDGIIQLNDDTASNITSMEISSAINVLYEEVAELDKEGESIEIVNELFGSLTRSLRTSFFMMMGEFGDITNLLGIIPNKDFKFVGTILVFVYLSTLMVVLLNLLIAIMGDSFSRVRNMQAIYFQQKRAEIIENMELMLTKKRVKQINEELKSYLHILLPIRASSVKQQKEEWEGTAKQIEQMFKKEINKTMKQYLTKMKTMKPKMKSAKITDPALEINEGSSSMEMGRRSRGHSLFGSAATDTVRFDANLTQMEDPNIIHSASSSDSDVSL